MKKASTLKNNFFYLLLKKYFFSLSILFIGPIAIILETNVMPYALKLLIDNLSHTSNKLSVYTNILSSMLLFISAYVSFLFIVRSIRYIESIFIPEFDSYIRQLIIERVMRNSYQYFSSEMSGNIVGKINDLTRAIEQIRSIICWNIIPILSVIICTLLMVYNIRVIFFWVIGLWVIIHIVLSIFYAISLSKLAKKNAIDKWELDGIINDIFHNIFYVKAFYRYKYEALYIANGQSKEKKSRTNLLKTTNYLQIIIDIPLIIMISSIIYFIVKAWQQDSITTGECVFIINVTFSLLHQLWSISQVLTNLSQHIGIIKQSIGKLKCMQPSLKSKMHKKINITKGTIELKNVSFSYPCGKQIFDNLNVSIESKQAIGIVGRSGSGKSTFLKLLLHLLNPEQGVIKIDGYDIRIIPDKVLINNISIAPSEAHLFCRTLLENVRYGRINSSAEDVISACQKAFAHDFISKMPEGYLSVIGKESIQLSTGQKQRILIARAFLKNAPILLLDEPTSGLDYITKSHIHHSIEELMHNKTTIITSHTLSTLKKMDRILVFKDGRIIEDGSPNQLAKTDGYYRAFFKL